VATIYQRKSEDGGNHWAVMIRLRGFPTEHRTFPNKTMAKLWAGKRETELREGRALLRRESERHTLRELVETYVEDIAPYTRRNKNLAKQAAVLKWWVGEIGTYRLCDITPAVIALRKRRLLNKPKASGRTRSPATANRYLAALSRVLTVAVKELGWMDSNPARKVERLPEGRGRTRFLSDAERERLLEACQSSSNALLWPAVAVALGTGGRKGEVLGLTWSDVDLTPGREAVTFRDTKNGETRSVALAGMALDGVRERHQNLRFGSPYVFPSQNGEKPASIRGAFETACAEADIEDFRFHDLRHTFASYLAMSGATLAEIAEALGHKTLAMVKRYAHLSQQHTRGVVTRMHRKYLAL